MSLDRLGNLATVVLAACALIITGLVVRRELAPPPADDGPRTVSGWESLLDGGHISGPDDSPLRVVEFSDFQCPFCRRVRPALQALEERYPGQVAVIFRHFPLEAIHPDARAAANAAECAAEQNRFRSMRDVLFAAQDEIGVVPFQQLAHRAGVQDLAAFRSCFDGRRYDDRVARDARAARDAGLRGTPSIIVNGNLLPGTPSPERLIAFADSLLEPDDPQPPGSSP